MPPKVLNPKDSQNAVFHAKRMSPGWVLIGTFLLLLLAIAGTLYQRFSTQPQNNFAFTASVKSAPVRQVSLPLAYETVGSLEANQKVALNPELQGVIQKIHFTEGQWVSAGMPLIQIDPDKQSAEVLETESSILASEGTLSSLNADYQAKLENVKSALAQKNWAQAEYGRYKNLWEKEFVSKQDFDLRQKQLETEEANYAVALKQKDSAFAKLQEAKASLESAKARYQRSRSNYADTLVRAPFSGQIGLKYVDIGDYVLPSEKLVTLVQANPLKATFNVPEQYLGALKKGLPIEIQTESLPEKVFHGSIIFVDPVVSDTNRSVTVKALIENQEHLLRPGQYTRIKTIFGTKENALVVPEESIVPQGERYFVYLAKQGKAVFKQVELGTRIPGWVEVRSGIQPKDRVIVGGIQKVQDGMTIQEASAQTPGKIKSKSKEVF